jgi:ProP effector
MKTVDVAAITKANATIDVLCQWFPHAFFRDGAKRRPLKIEIHFDLVVALDGAIPSLDLRAALKAYTASLWYRRALTAGAARIDLNGDEAGEVSAKHAEIARQSLTKRSSTPTSKPRDSFAALKAAAALRRQQQQQ